LSLDIVINYSFSSSEHKSRSFWWRQLHNRHFDASNSSKRDCKTNPY